MLYSFAPVTYEIARELEKSEKKNLREKEIKGEEKRLLNENPVDSSVTLVEEDLDNKEKGYSTDDLKNEELNNSGRKEHFIEYSDGTVYQGETVDRLREGNLKNIHFD